MQKLIKHLPPHFSNINELNKLFEIEEELFHDADEKMNTVRNNNFIQTADIVGIEKFEELFGIVPEPTDTLEFRRFRVLNRISMKPPFTTPFLRSRLNDLLPNYTLTFDYDNYIMYIESYMENSQYFNELNITISTIKPCNIVLRYKPLIRRNLLINSETKYTRGKWNYILNGTWYFNQDLPFYSVLSRAKKNGNNNTPQFIKNLEQNKLILKSPNMKSFNVDYLMYLKDLITKSITKVILTNTNQETNEITSFTVQENGVLEYFVPQTFGNINNIKLYSNDMIVENYDTIWLSNGADANIKHEITLLEGVL